MTRKEICKATGLSIKTLRLYEEKGLIAPHKERRNGREYREYTPELVSQLNQIVTLRRALFTMDEIREMQTQPDRIFSIFQYYRTWLSQQEQQLKKLRAAADRVSAESLSDLDGLVSGLQDAAAEMPLPALDIKPNFKRLDELDEGPRHVEPQVNLDDTVPNAKVFRQMTVTVDRDRLNDVNMAFGQLQATREAFLEGTGTGPVQKNSKHSKWYNLLLALLMILTVLCAVLAYFGRLPWVLAGISLLLTAGLLGIPLWLEHRRWLKNAQQADAENTSPEAYQRARKRRALLTLAGTAGVLVIALGVYALARVLYAQAHPIADYRVCFVSPVELPKEKLNDLGDAIARWTGDLDGNGKSVAAVDLRTATLGGMVSPSGTTYHTTVDFNEFVKSGEYPLFFFASLEYQGVNISRIFEFYHCCQALPDDLADPNDPYRADLSGAKVFTDTGLSEIPVYACISGAATEEEYAFAVELLRNLLDG